jgi:hypothetical protein
VREREEAQEVLRGLTGELAPVLPALQRRAQRGDVMEAKRAALCGALQDAYAEARRQEAIFEMADAPQTVSQLYRTRLHLVQMARHVAAACRQILNAPPERGTTWCTARAEVPRRSAARGSSRLRPRAPMRQPDPRRSRTPRPRQNSFLSRSKSAAAFFPARVSLKAFARSR